MQNAKNKFDYHQTLDPALLPDLNTKAVPKEEAANQLNHSEISEGQIWVCFEAGPWEWGVGYSLSSHPESYDMMSNPHDWYLECYYGFDVIFTDC